ncbi:hypothetical protein GCM10027598_71600 [Amycolatopsis oliviviridis]|uniref:Uncharacterized protein n=1 Tax=Amycolatopsis oliviviridis TaxID=1471590 RepID=A0ABQ3L3P2_9PSEU|nr:hypothetical protein [Amycolatopsis oliviviridis]GHH01513.1 hypothetical protein GCM10017790_01540 [Amycolatopsis oliviviridis]
MGRKISGSKKRRRGPFFRVTVIHNSSNTYQELVLDPQVGISVPPPGGHGSRWAVPAGTENQQEDIDIGMVVEETELPYFKDISLRFDYRSPSLEV